MATITIGVGVKIDLSIEWVPLADVHVLLVNTWGQHRRTVADWWQLTGSWVLMLLRLWREDKIELAGRRGDLAAELKLIFAPISERLALNFDISGVFSRLYCRLNDTTFFDLHLRAKATVEPAVTLVPASHEPVITLPGTPQAAPAAALSATPQAAPGPEPEQALPEGSSADPTLPPPVSTPEEFVTAYLRRPGVKHSRRGLCRARDEAGLRGTPGFGKEKLLLWWPGNVEKNRGGPGSKG
jgi:hypothetical protein